MGLAEYLWRAKQPYNVSVAAETAACAALSNPQYLEVSSERSSTVEQYCICVLRSLQSSLLFACLCPRTLNYAFMSWLTSQFFGLHFLLCLMRVVPLGHQTDRARRSCVREEAAHGAIGVGRLALFEALPQPCQLHPLFSSPALGCTHCQGKLLENSVRNSVQGILLPVKRWGSLPFCLAEWIVHQLLLFLRFLRCSVA